METKTALAELKATKCHCGKNKATMKSLCRTCYFALPEHMRRALYKRIFEGYEEAYQASIEYLDGLKSQEIPLAK